MPIKTESLSDFGIRNISGYATEVNLDRAIPELYDGLKPVLRRVAWSMNFFKSGDAIKSAKVVGHCFAAGTRVFARFGNSEKGYTYKEVSIETLKVGDWVYTHLRNENDSGFRRVIRTFVIPNSETLIIRSVQGISVECTPDQVFYDYETGVDYKASELSVGQTIYGYQNYPHPDGKAIALSIESIEPVEGIKTTYDIEVEEAHRFYANGFLVHNCIGSYHPHGDCLDANTKFYGLDGSIKTIEELTKQGKPVEVLAYDEKNDKLVPAIAHSWRIGQVTTQKYHIELSDGSKVTCTNNHPFYVRGIGWVKAENLDVGMSLLGGGINLDDASCIGAFKKAGKLGYGTIITSIEVENCKPTPMYDFTVDKYHNALIIVSDKKYRGVETFVVAHNSAAYGAMQTMVHHNVPLLEGIGNWGGLLDPAAASRYTNVKMSKLGASVFDPDYLAVTDMVPNYDDTAKEPVVLPVRLPLLVLNGAEGIGVGITSSIPTFTVESVIEVLTEIFSGKKLEPKDYARILKPKQHWGGHLVNSAANKKAWLELMETGKAKVQFEPHLKVDEAKKSIVIDEWPNGLSVDKFVDKVRALPECQRCYNSKGSYTFTIECKKAYNLTQFQEFVQKIQRLARVNSSYKFNVTHRLSETNDGITTYQTEFLSLSVPQFFVRWSQLRLQLEKRCLEHRMRKQQAVIDCSKLLIFACDHLTVIFKALKVKNSAQFLVDHLKITQDQANQILDLKVRALSKLDQDALKARLRDQEKAMRELQSAYKRPKAKIKAEFSDLLKLIEMDKRSKAKRFSQELTVH